MKKILIMVPVIALLAAGCGSSPSAKDNSQSAGQQSNGTQTSITASTAKEVTSPSGSVWQGTLQASDSLAAGKYMITVSGHKIYLKTSRDFNALLGKQVIVSYSGSLTSFALNDITAQ